MLFESGVIQDDSIVLSNGVLVYTYALSKCRNRELYSYMYNQYGVKAAMKKMLSFPRLGKRIVALSYLVLGKKLFFSVYGSISHLS